RRLRLTGDLHWHRGEHRQAQELDGSLHTCLLASRERQRGSEFVENLPQQTSTPFYVAGFLDALRAKAIDHTQNAPALFGFRDDDLRRIRCGAENATHLRHI